MSIPNIITLCRLLSVPVAVWLIELGRLDWAFWLFIAAGISDAFDGFVARVFQSRTVLGAYLDPLADKALLVCVYVALGHAGHLPLWLVILVVFRDVLIVGGVMLLYTLKEVLSIQPLAVSKLNTFAQILLAGWTLAAQGFGFDGGTALRVLVYVVAATTVLSGAAYLYRGSLAMSRQGTPQ